MSKEYFDKVIEWYDNESDRLFIISGYAGCGKTTLARKIPEVLGIDNFNFLAPTGKAAVVLGNASTIHSYLYYVDKCKRTGQLNFVKKGPEWFNQELLIVDEISMVGDQLMKDLMSLNIPIIGLGDPAQLPPVNGSNEILETPDIFLTKVYRNDGGLLDLATDIRQNKQIKKQYNSVEFRKNILEDIDMIGKDSIVICRFNESRRILNLILRQYIYDFTELIEVGEKIMILNNDKDLGLMNGSIVEVIRIVQDVEALNVKVLWVRTDDGRELGFNANMKTITQKKNQVNTKTYKALDIDYAYCITCHKSQGSEFNKVFIMKEGIRFEDWEKWYYTAVTRARQQLYIYPDMSKKLKELFE